MIYMIYKAIALLIARVTHLIYTSASHLCGELWISQVVEKDSTNRMLVFIFN